jgi:voltage-gated potassium channel Kch
MFKDNPLMLIGVFFAISSMIFAFQIYIIERRAALLSAYTTGISNNYTNALWLVLITITTVGYGDYFPHTDYGRVIILIVAIWGIFIISMMVVVVSNTLTM